MNAQQKWKLPKFYAFHFTSDPDGDRLAGTLHEKESINHMMDIPDRSEGIVKVSA